MENKYLIKHVNSITRIKFSKNPSYSDAREVIDDIAENFPYEKRLWDFSRIKFDFTIDIQISKGLTIINPSLSNYRTKRFSHKFLPKTS